MKVAGEDSNPGPGAAPSTIRDFIVCNVTPYGDEIPCRADATAKAVWEKLQPYFRDEQRKGVLAVDAKAPSTLLLAHKAGYIPIAGAKSSSACRPAAPFKPRRFSRYGGLRMVKEPGSRRAR